MVQSQGSLSRKEGDRRVRDGDAMIEAEERKRKKISAVTLLTLKIEEGGHRPKNAESFKEFLKKSRKQILS